MNKHFEDGWYYLRRAAGHFGRGIRIELEPAERRVREWTGEKYEPKPSRREKVRSNLREAEQTAKRRSRDAMRDVRKRIRMS
ncbi:DUF7553 family protein [Haladaptatus halobius]|jgi:hypothetical protein|uniref:DUF7553 family protein n=1 Tax=Haladaptatus halobius TaxID=2884875 RepID=UPI001D0AE979|nr:hypothetical protein [Haladaptatus halobius]